MSLALPAFAVLEAPLLWGKSRETIYFGVQCLLVGFFYWPGWLANPLLVAALLCHGLRRHRASAILAGLAILSAIAAPFLLAGSKQHTLLYLHVGYYVWLTSLVLFWIAKLATPERTTFDRDGSRRAPPTAIARRGLADEDRQTGARPRESDEPRKDLDPD